MIAIALCMVFLGQEAVADESLEKAYLTLALSHRENMIRQINHEIKQHHDQIRKADDAMINRTAERVEFIEYKGKPRLIAPSKEALANYLDGYRKKLAEARERRDLFNQTSIPLAYPTDFKRGMVCMILARVHVVQVINEKSALVRVDDTYFMLKDWDTSDRIDGKDYSIKNEVFHVEGTTTYKATVGTNTVYEVRQLSADEKKRCLIYWVNNAPPLPTEKDPRIWRDVSGKSETTASFIGLDKNSVRLKKDDGKEITVPLAKLSKDDRKWLVDNVEPD